MDPFHIDHFPFRDFGFPKLGRAPARIFSASRQRRSRAACSAGSVIGTSTPSWRMDLPDVFRDLFFMSVSILRNKEREFSF